MPDPWSWVSFRQEIDETVSADTVHRAGQLAVIGMLVAILLILLLWLVGDRGTFAPGAQKKVTRPEAITPSGRAKASAVSDHERTQKFIVAAGQLAGLVRDLRQRRDEIARGEEELRRMVTAEFLNRTGWRTLAGRGRCYKLFERLRRKRLQWNIDANQYNLQRLRLTDGGVDPELAGQMLHDLPRKIELFTAAEASGRELPD